MGLRDTTRSGPRISTRWSLVRQAGDSADPRQEEALQALCQAYWPAVYAFVRRRGYEREDALDLTQGFFARFLEKNDVRGADREKGRFRTFILACAKHYLANERSRRQAEKRGGGKAPLSLDSASAEALPGLQVADTETPEKVFARQWAHTVLERVLVAMESKAVRSGERDRFHLLKPLLTGEVEKAGYRQLGKRLEMSEGAVRIAVHRLRKRYGTLLRAEVAGTVSDPEMVDEEIRFLIEALH